VFIILKVLFAFETKLQMPSLFQVVYLSPTSNLPTKFFISL